MAFITADRVKDTSTTTGTGNITVSGSAPFGYRTFSTVLSVGDTFYYCIQGQGTAEWEVGLGTYASTNQFARTTILASSASGSAVSFSSGTKNVFITLPANKTLQFDATGSPIAGGILYGTGSMLAYSAAGTAGQFLQSTGGGAPTWASAVTSSSIVNGTSNVSIASANGAITAVTAGTTAMTINTSGNVGIGTSSPDVNLSVFGSAAVAADVGGSISIGGYYNGSSKISYASISGVNQNGTGNTSGQLLFNTRTNFGSLTERMRIDSSGNVGIGTSSPGTQLNVYKSTATQVAIRPQNSLAYADFGPIADGTVYGPYAAPAASTSLLIGTSNSNPVAFWTNGSERMRIDSNGNVIAGGSVALATTATNGFLYVPTCAGTPTGTPTAVTGMAPIVVNTTNNKLYFYSGGAWRDAGP